MATEKPDKPYPDFPLFAHATRRWAKKVRGKMCYFGPWADPQAALTKYLDQKDDLYAGRSPRKPEDVGLTVRDLCNQFLTAKRHRLENEELGQRMFKEYHAACERLVDAFGRNKLVSDLRAEDFEQLRATLSKGVGPVTLSSRVRLTRIVFKYAYDSDLIDKPIKMGPSFKGPSKKTLRAERQSKPLRLIEAAELRGVIENASIPMRAMVLLAINTAFGNGDISSLPITALDLEGGWVTYPRPKTAIMRRCPLWPETVAALKEAIAIRPKAKRPEFDGLVFLTKSGLPLVRMGSNFCNIDSLGQLFSSLLTKCGLKRENLGFYALRHSFETIAGATKDQIAVSHIMGHSPSSDDMSSIYRERIDDERLRAVSDHVRAWLWPETITAK